MKLSILFLPLLLILVIACSNDDNGNALEEPQAKEMLYLPNSMTLEYDYGSTVHYRFNYNARNQFDRISMTRVNVDAEERQSFIDFSYNTLGHLTRIDHSEQDSDDVTQISFEYDENGFPSDMVQINSDGTQDYLLSKNANINRYTLAGVFAHLPLQWTFDDQDRLEIYTIVDKITTLNKSETDRGIFADVNLQPAHHIWHGYILYLAPFELNYLSQNKLLYAQSNDPYSQQFQNFLVDSNDNIITLKMVIPLTFSIKYTISYETREKQ